MSKEKPKDICDVLFESVLDYEPGKDGWWSIVDMAKKHNTSVRTVQRLVLEWHKAGKTERRDIAVVDKIGRRSKSFAYRLKQD